MADTVTVTLRRRRGGALEENGTVEGELVAPGLAITPRRDSPGFSLTHVGSGLAFVTGYCDTHIRAAAERTLAAGADWTVDVSVLTGDTHKATLGELARSIRDELGFECRKRCYHDGAPTCRVRCNTCGWQLDDDDEWMDAKAAKRAADDHECEPEMQIWVPGPDRWFLPYQVNDDGAVPGVKKPKEG